jgi:transforming growth factor-beta-induced protein
VDASADPPIISVGSAKYIKAGEVFCATQPTLFDLVVAKENLTSLVNAIVTSGLVDLLSGGGNYTVFAPNNDAIAAADADGLVTKYLTPSWKVHLQVLLRYHVTSGTIVAADIMDGMAIPMLTVPSEDITASVGDTVSFSGASFSNSTVIEADLIADNGVVHVVDKIFFPTQLTLNLLEASESVEGFSQVLSFIVSSGLESTLSNDTVTIFAPGNTAFANLPADFLTQAASDPAFIKEALSNHIVAGVWPKELLTDGLELTSLAGYTLTISVSGGPFPMIMVNNATIELVDAVASNGIAHVIDSLLLPPIDNSTTTTPAAAPTSAGAPVAAPGANLPTVGTQSAELNAPRASGAADPSTNEWYYLLAGGPMMVGAAAALLL